MPQVSEDQMGASIRCHMAKNFQLDRSRWKVGAGVNRVVIDLHERAVI